MQPQGAALAAGKVLRGLRDGGAIDSQFEDKLSQYDVTTCGREVLAQSATEMEMKLKRTTRLRCFGGAVLAFNLWLIGRYNLPSVPAIALTFGFAIGYEMVVVRHHSTGTHSGELESVKIARAANHGFDKRNIGTALLAFAALVCAGIALWVALAARSSPPPLAADEASTKPIEAFVDFDTPTFDSKGWTQESTGNHESGPWLKYDRPGTRYYRDAKGVIYRLYPPGIKPEAAKANPFGLDGALTTVPPR